MTELKPCPFCGNDEIDCCYEAEEDVYEFYFCKCKACGATAGFYQTEQEAIAAWNKRYDD